MFKKLLKSRTFWTTIVLILVIGGVAAYVYLNPAPTPIPMGFTWFQANQKGETEAQNVVDTNLRVLYTTGLVIIQNKNGSKDDAFQFMGGTWYYRTTREAPVRVIITDGAAVVKDYPGIMSVSNDMMICPKDTTCRAQGVLLLTKDGKTVYIETSPKQYLVINP
jgi:hypothetical protein